MPIFIFCENKYYLWPWTKCFFGSFTTVWHWSVCRMQMVTIYCKFLFFRCIQLHTKRKPGPSTWYGKPVSAHSLPHPTVQPCQLSALLPPDRLWASKWQPSSVWLLLASRLETQWCSSPRKPSYRDHCLQPVPRKWGRREQWWGSHYQARYQLHCHTDTA